MKPYLKMGGNLKKMDKIFVRFPLKNKRSVGIINTNENISEEEDNIKNINDDANVHVTDLLENSAFWRSGRNYNIYELQNLLDPVSLFEGNLWNLDVVSNHDYKPTSSDFEDNYNYYSNLGKNMVIKSFYQAFLMHMQRRINNTGRIARNITQTRILGMKSRHVLFGTDFKLNLK